MIVSDPTPSAPGEPSDCRDCGVLRAREFASQKGGWADHDTFLPTAWKRLECVRDFRPGDPRAIQLLRCSGCGAWFLYRAQYEYLAGGSEDEQLIFRLDPSQAEEILAGNLERIPES